MNKIYKQVSWKKYIIPYQRESIDEYMELNGENFYTRVVDLIYTACKFNRKKIVICKFIGMDIFVTIEHGDYLLALKYCLKWFENKEHYEYCAIVKEYIDELEMLNSMNKKLKYLDKSSQRIFI